MPYFISATWIPVINRLAEAITVWMSHSDKIEKMPPEFESLAYTENTPVAVMGNNKNMFCIQFHPEVVHTPQGKVILENFVYNICGCHGNWTMGNFIVDSIEKIRQQVGSGKVINAISGGVDSSVVATLIHKAIGKQLTCIF
jgi:GMP synthase (glutamine-hydrolysing)